MPHFEQLEIIGWHHNSVNHFLCNKCFLKVKEIIQEKDYEPLQRNELVAEEDLFICDLCRKKVFRPSLL